MSEHSGFRFDVSVLDFVKASVVAVASHVFAELITEEGKWIGALAALAVAALVTLAMGRARQLGTVLVGIVSLVWVVQAARNFDEKHLLPGCVGFGGLWFCYWLANRGEQGTTSFNQAEVQAAYDSGLEGKRDRMVVPTKAFKAEGLIVFLSPLTVPDAWRTQVEAAGGSKTALVDALIKGLGEEARFGKPGSLRTLEKLTWFMPMRAIEDQVITPPVSDTVRVVVIASADEKKGERVIPGTRHEVADFERLVARMCGDLKVQIEVIGTEGVPFEDMEALSKAVNAAKESIRSRAPERADRRPIVIDITGGQKPCSAVGAALSFARHECIQYVSTTDGKVTMYDLGYAPKPNPVGH